jgi:hypothetical protein
MKDIVNTVFKRTLIRLSESGIRLQINLGILIIDCLHRLYDMVYYSRYLRSEENDDTSLWLLFFDPPNEQAFPHSFAVDV